MLHGDVISQTHGPGVNLFKPAVDGRRFWVSAKSPVFGWTIAVCCDYCDYCNYFDYLTLSFSVTCSSLQWIRLCAHTSSVSSAPPSFIQKQSKNLRSSWTLNSICKSHDCHCGEPFIPNDSCGTFQAYIYLWKISNHKAVLFHEPHHRTHDWSHFLAHGFQNQGVFWWGMILFIILIILIILIIALICADSCPTGHPGTNLGQQAPYACKDRWRSWRKIPPYSSSCMVGLYQENISSWPARAASRRCILRCILRPGWRLITLLSSCGGNTQYQAVRLYESIFLSALNESRPNLDFLEMEVTT